MEGTLALLTEADLLFLADALAPGGDRGRMVRVLHEDEEILRGMLADDRLFGKIAGSAEVTLQVSPRLLFCVLMARVKRDLEGHGYTVEGLPGVAGTAIVFDGPRVARMLEDKRIADYLVEVLASFVQVRSRTTTVRVRKGVWRRTRFNDLDLMGMIRHTATLDEEERFDWYRRIGDLCLFLTGVFPEYVARGAGARSSRLPPRESCVENGRSFYMAASRHPNADARLAEVLARLAEAFDLAIKPLAHISSRYLGSLRDQLFTG